MNTDIPKTNATEEQMEALKGTLLENIPEDDENMSVEEMIPKSMVDEYIQQSINQRWADKLEMEKAETEARRTREEATYNEYNNAMQESPEPWVDLKGYQETPQGLKISLDWNDAFINYLKAQGLTGMNDDEIVHKYLSLLMRDVTATPDESETSEFE